MRSADKKAASDMVLDNGTVITECDRCREMWKERNDRGVEGDPPCKGCDFDPEIQSQLMDENLCAAKIFLSVRDQVLMYFNGEYQREYDINHTAVWGMIDHFPRHIEKPFEVFELVVSVYRHFLKERNDSSIGWDKSDESS